MPKPAPTATDDAPPTAPSEARLTALVAAITGAFFVATALPSIHWHDTAEFAAVGWRLAVSHPPGHPIHALLTRATEHFIPLGDLALRANMLSALLAAAALAAFYRLLRALAPALPRAAALCAACAPAFLPGLWLQAVRAEVYALQLLLTVCIAHACHRVARGDDARALPALALLFGLAGANHSFIGLCSIPLALWAIAAGRPPPRAFAAAVAAGLLGLAAYLYLPLRATAGGVVGWGRPDSLAALWATISGRDWQGNIAPADGEAAADHVATMAAWIITQLGPLGAAIVLLALLAGLPALVRARRLTALAAAVAAAVPLAAQRLLQVDLHNPDMAGYLAAVPLALIALAAIAVDALPGRARALLALAFPALLLAGLGRHDPSHRAGSRSAERVALARLDAVPPDGVLVASDYATTFQTWALQALWGERPDVAPVFRGRVAADWQRRRLRAEHPAIAAALDGFPATLTGPAVRYELGVEMHRLGPLAPRLRPVGLLLAVDAPWPAALDPAYDLIDAAPDLDARRAGALLHAQHAEHIARAGGPQALAAAHLDRAEALAPGDPWLAELRAAINATPGSPNLLDPVRPR
ncbi:MAG: DUF2723 domain-containing protein [Myxococcales bacterium]|nr:DUF2723 domain-containing protein [Myxococcales bacterium]